MSCSEPQARQAPSKLLAPIRLLQFIGLFVVFGCGAFGGCDNSGPGAEDLLLGGGLSIDVSSTGDPAPLSRGEDFDATVVVRRLAPENLGDLVDVHITAPPGVVMDENDKQVAISGDTTTVHFAGHIEDPVSSGATRLAASRTSAIDPKLLRADGLYAERQIYLLANGARVTFNPNPLLVPANETRPVIVSILPVGGSEGRVSIDLIKGPGSGAITFDPYVLDVDLVRGSTIPITTTVNVRNGPLGESGTILARIDEAVVGVGRVIASTGSWEFTGSPVEFALENHVLSNEVRFSLSSTEDRDVKIHWESYEEVQPQPNDQDFSIHVQRGRPATFTRRFYRYEPSGDVQVRFTATDETAKESKLVTVTIHLQ